MFLWIPFPYALKNIKDNGISLKLLNINIEFWIWKLVDIGKCVWKYLYIWISGCNRKVLCAQLMNKHIENYFNIVDSESASIQKPVRFSLTHSKIMKIKFFSDKHIFTRCLDEMTSRHSWIHDHNGELLVFFILWAMIHE